MARLEIASPEQIDTITRESYVLWGGGLSFESYRDLWEEVAGTRWCRRHASYQVWVDDDGEILSSMKVYRPRMRLLDRVGICSVFGAVFTPRSLRRRGYASKMVEAGVAAAVERGDLAVVLFSDIGTRFYQELGFRTLPALEQFGRLPGRPVRDSNLVIRPAKPDELEWICRAHEASSAARPVAVLRDIAHWEFLWIRSHSFFAKVHGAGVRHEWRVAFRGREFLGYLISVEGRGEWNVREVGSIGGEVAEMAEILREAGGDAFRRGCRRVYGWLPDDLVRALDDWSLRGRRRRRAIPMLRVDRASSALAATIGSPSMHIPFQDQF